MLLKHTEFHFIAAMAAKTLATARSYCSKPFKRVELLVPFSRIEKKKSLQVYNLNFLKSAKLLMISKE